jgi:hypothetical protein
VHVAAAHPGKVNAHENFTRLWFWNNEFPNLKRAIEFRKNKLSADCAAQ